LALLLGCCHFRKPFKGNVTPTVPVFQRRIEFYELKQNDRESVGVWFAAIKSVVINCNFRVSLNDVLKDKFVWSLKTNRVLDRLCEKEPEHKT